MKQGKSTLPVVREFIIKTKTISPSLSYEEIADKVKSECGTDIDRSTVGRILRRHKDETATQAVSSPAQEPSQPASEAQRKHRQTIENMLLDWQRELGQQSRLAEAGLEDTSPAYVEAKRLFTRVLEHCPSVRNAYDELAKRRHVYEERWTGLEPEIRKLAPPEAVEGFATTVLFYALSMSEGNAAPNYYVDGKCLQIDQGPQRITIAKGSARIRRQVGKQHLELVERYAKNQWVLEMGDMKKAILEQQHQLANTLEDCIDSQEYLNPAVRCGLCPS